MKKFVTLFLLLIIVHMTNGKTIEFPKAKRYFLDKTSLTIWDDTKVLAEFLDHAVTYIEKK